MNHDLPEGVQCLAVTPQEKNTLEIFRTFYYDVYVKAFPNPDECESYENLIAYIDKYGESDLYVHILLFYTKEDIVGGVIFDYFDDIKTLAIEFIVVADKYQRRGLAGKMIDYTKTYLKDVHHRLVEWMIIEIDNPQYVESSDFSYMYFWDKCNMRAIDFNYIQPALSPNQNPVEVLLLCARKESHDSNLIEREHVKKFLTLYAHYAMKIEYPLKDNSIQAMFTELDNRDEDVLELISLNNYFAF